jgi:NDP-sugar pyrophosphorylase family protein
VQAVILAAGRGKRLHPITITRTKAMAPILGIPIIERVMEPLVANGIREFVLVTSPDDVEILDHFQRRTRLEAQFTLVPQPEPLGMGHALLQAAPYIHGAFLLSACDNLVNFLEIGKLLATWESEAPNAILTTLRVGPADIVRMGIVALDGDWVTRIVEKPVLAEAPSDIGSVPLYLFSTRLLTYLVNISPSPRGEYELQDAIQMLVQRDGQVKAFELSKRADLTTPADLLAINLDYLAKGNPESKMILQEVGTGTRFKSPVYIEDGVIVGSDCLIGPKVYLEHDCVIGNGVHLENAVVLRKRQVAPGTRAKNLVIC